MNEFEIEVTIQRPVKAVFAFLINIDQAPTWNPSLTLAKKTSPGPVKVGTTLLYAGKFMDQDYQSEAVCTAYRANQKFSTKTTSGPINLEIQSHFKALSGATKLNTRYRGESQGFFKLADPLLLALMKIQFETATQNLRTLLEEEPAKST